MKIHEYQAKERFRRYAIPVPDGRAAGSVAGAEEIVGDLSTMPVVIKAQIHAGGRGKGGGVKIARTAEEARDHIRKILGMTLVTPQTGPEGRPVKTLLIEKGQNIARELYLAILPDRGSGRIMIMASTAGGMNIEDLAVSDPDRIIRVGVDPLLGLMPFHCRAVVYGLGLDPAPARELLAILPRIYRLFIDSDCSLLEINPLVVTDVGTIVALDAKMEIDGNALFRRPELAALHDPDEEDPLEARAAAAGLNYIKLEGNVGNMVNGAGLAMATMDLIKNAGAAPANFLDVGGGANAEMVEKGFQIILSDPRVRGVLVNIFGGILRCDVLAQGLVEAARKTGITVPVVVRMEGTNVEAGRQILADSGLNLITAVDLADAAQKVSEIVNTP